MANKPAKASDEAKAKRTDPDLYARIVRRISRDRLKSTGGKRSWDAYAAGQAVRAYEREFADTYGDDAEPYTSPKPSNTPISEWFREEWVSLHPESGEIIGACGTRTYETKSGRRITLEKSDPPLRCLPKKRAVSMSRAQRRETAKRKAGAALGDNVAVRKDNPSPDPAAGVVVTLLAGAMFASGLGLVLIAMGRDEKTPDEQARDDIQGGLDTTREDLDALGRLFGPMTL